jgi:membrane protease YdiL (CAAX protease family)
MTIFDMACCRRGFGLRSLLKFTRNEGTAIVGAALLFGLAHQLPLGETLTLSGVGVCLGLAYVKGGQNLVVPILAHSTYNLLALVVGAE